MDITVILKSTKKYKSKKLQKIQYSKNMKNIISQCLWDENTVIMLNFSFWRGGE